jgi:hypothetical protein
MFLISIKSRKIELAVSIPPAPLPIIVCWPECWHVNVIALRVPSTQIGSFLETGFGATTSFFPSQHAINFMAFHFFRSLTTWVALTPLIPVL